MQFMFSDAKVRKFHYGYFGAYSSLRHLDLGNGNS